VHRSNRRGSRRRPRTRTRSFPVYCAYMPVSRTSSSRDKLSAGH
jgi:hypothetical protein